MSTIKMNSLLAHLSSNKLKEDLVETIFAWRRPGSREDTLGPRQGIFPGCHMKTSGNLSGRNSMCKSMELDNNGRMCGEKCAFDNLAGIRAYQGRVGNLVKLKSW